MADGVEGLGPYNPLAVPITNLLTKPPWLSKQGSPAEFQSII